MFIVRQETIASYAKHIVKGISEVRELISIMLKGDDGQFFRQLTDLIFGQNLTNAITFFNVKDSDELRLYYEYQSAGMAAFIIRWTLGSDLTEDEAAALLCDILLQEPSGLPEQFERQRADRV